VCGALITDACFPRSECWSARLFWLGERNVSLAYADHPVWHDTFTEPCLHVSRSTPRSAKVKNPACVCRYPPPKLQVPPPNRNLTAGVVPKIPSPTRFRKRSRVCYRNTGNASPPANRTTRSPHEAPVSRPDVRSRRTRQALPATGEGHMHTTFYEAGYTHPQQHFIWQKRTTFWNTGK
jgi:hypothetical protein